MTVFWRILSGDIGTALVAVTDERICWLGMADKGLAPLHARFRAAWGHETCIEQDHPLMPSALLSAPPPLPLLLRATEFQRIVWSELEKIPRGHIISYGDLAGRIGKPTAARAVGNAVGANPIAWLIPCHRVGHSDGSLRGYLWGEDCKRRLLALEGYI